MGEGRVFKKDERGQGIQKGKASEKRQKSVRKAFDDFSMLYVNAIYVLIYSVGVARPCFIFSNIKIIINFYISTINMVVTQLH
jgi:hypothetical protein